MEEGEILSLDNVKTFEEPCIVAIGIFDGLHRGHQRVLSKAISCAKREGVKVCVITFSPHPSKFLGKKGKSFELIYPIEVRVEKLLDFGIDYVFIKRFDKRFSSLDAEGFIGYMHRKFPRLVGIVTGENFRFGRGAEGNPEWLREHKSLLDKYCIGVRSVSCDKEAVSSSRLRKFLRVGDLRRFRKLTGYDYFAEGEIEKGKGLGKVIGFPTLNMRWEVECSLPYGVYLIRFKNLDSGRVYYGVANYGVNPTTGEEDPVVESHLFRRVSFGVGVNARVEFLKFLREEKKFKDIESLVLQIRKDVIVGKKSLQKRECSV